MVNHLGDPILLTRSPRTQLEVRSNGSKNKSWSATVGAGVTNIMLATGIRNEWQAGRAPKDLFAVQGICPSVGISGESTLRILRLTYNYCWSELLCQACLRLLGY